MATQADADRLLDAAEELFYERGYQAVGMDALRSSAGIPLKRIYTLFKGKDDIAVAMLDRRDDSWMSSLAERVEREIEPEEKILAIFDWLADWLSGAGHRGCAWVNAFGELGETSPGVTDAVRRHKARLRSYVHDLATEADASQPVAEALFLLVEGSMVTAGIAGKPDAATQGRKAAALLLRI